MKPSRQILFGIIVLLVIAAILICVWYGRQDRFTGIHDFAENTLREDDAHIDKEKVLSIENEAKHLLDLMAKDPFNETRNYHRESSIYLVENAPETVPFILANLKDQDEYISRHLLSTLRTIIRKGRLGSKGRSKALMEDIIRDITSKQSISRGYGIGILTDLYEVYSDNKQEDRQRIVQALQNVINNTDDRRLRAGATIGLIRISPVDGYREAFKDNRITDGKVYRYNGPEEKAAFYDQDGWREVVYAIEATANLTNMTTIDQMKEWWEQNKDRLEAEQAAAADAVGAKNQNNERPVSVTP